MTRFEMATLVAWRTLGSALDDANDALNAGLHDEAWHHLNVAIRSRQAFRELDEDLPAVLRRELFRIRKALTSGDRQGSSP